MGTFATGVWIRRGFHYNTLGETLSYGDHQKRRAHASRRSEVPG